MQSWFDVLWDVEFRVDKRASASVGTVSSGMITGAEDGLELLMSVSSFSEFRNPVSEETIIAPATVFSIQPSLANLSLEVLLDDLDILFHFF